MNHYIITTNSKLDKEIKDRITEINRICEEEVKEMVRNGEIQKIEVEKKEMSYMSNCFV